jgi:hypothetical protein
MTSTARDRERSRRLVARRRRLLARLAGAFVVALTLGAIPALAPVRYVAVALLVVLLAYLALLAVNQRNARAGVRSFGSANIVPMRPGESFASSIDSQVHRLPAAHPAFVVVNGRA